MTSEINWIKESWDNGKLANNFFDSVFPDRDHISELMQRNMYSDQLIYPNELFVNSLHLPTPQSQVLFDCGLPKIIWGGIHTALLSQPPNTLSQLVSENSRFQQCENFNEVKTDLSDYIPFGYAISLGTDEDISSTLLYFSFQKSTGRIFTTWAQILRLDTSRNPFEWLPSMIFHSLCNESIAEFWKCIIFHYSHYKYYPKSNNSHLPEDLALYRNFQEKFPNLDALPDNFWSASLGSFC